MQVLLVEFRIAAERVADFASAIAANAAATLAGEPGCRRFDVCRDPLDPTRFVLYELYDDAAAVAAHLAAPHFKQMDAATAGWVTHKSVQRLELPGTA
jgi:(4S)-4-hydroxy-5-phosphonooxypentane-2,3-dione isomerase